MKEAQYIESRVEAARMVTRARHGEAATVANWVEALCELDGISESTAWSWVTRGIESTDDAGYDDGQRGGEESPNVLFVQMSAPQYLAVERIAVLHGTTIGEAAQACLAAGIAAQNGETGDAGVAGLSERGAELVRHAAA